MSFSLPGKFILAPMAGITDAAFREQCKRYGAALTVTELTSVEGIVRKEQELQDVLDVRKGEKPSIQLFGSNINSVVKAAKIVEPYASVIDFNLGCPAPHITAQMCGAALLMKPEKIKEIFVALVNAVNLPVTAKIRAGPNENNLVYLDIAKVLEEAGVSMITLHPRTVRQGYSGKADWDRIKQLKESVSIPVCGNGDVETPEDALRMMEETGCDYVMIGRATRGNPFIFKQCNDLLEKGSYEEISDEEQLQAWGEYVDKAIKYGIKFSRIKGQAQNYSRGLSGAKKIREAISPARTVDELQKAFLHNI